MRSSPDRVVLGCAGLMDMVLVTKDGDFDDLALLGGENARVLRLDLGNCTTDEIEHALRMAAEGLPSLFETNRLVAIVRQP
jgi:predicted nuclease of predicted toxin-antitoxin system